MSPSGHDGIFLIQPDGRLVELRHARYESEDLLQELLARYPDLLAGGQVDPDEPRRWLLVAREVGIPDAPDAANRWSVDHLLLDQDGIPTLVEVKRSTDSRIRREVVGQMLDYAANGVVHWPVERIQETFRAQCARSGTDAASVLALFLGSEEDLEFWSRVKTNLQAGRVRLVFLADVIPPELRRVVEFLNEQMDPAEVLAVEIRQYVGEGLRTLVPRVIGRTEQAQSKKAPGVGSFRQWDESSFFESLTQRQGKEAAAVAKALVAWARQAGVDTWWGRGLRDGSFLLWREEARDWFLSCFAYGKVEILFEHMRKQGRFASLEMRTELLQRLNAIPGVVIPADGVERRPTIPLATLQPSGSLEAFVAVLDWMLEAYRSADAAHPESRT